MFHLHTPDADICKSVMWAVTCIFLCTGDGEHDCQLNCRAVGFRFYVRQSDDVIDGSSCGQKLTSVCVAGKCEVGIKPFLECFDINIIQWFF